MTVNFSLFADWVSITDNNDVYTPVIDITTQDIPQKLQKVVKTGAAQG
ncbi:MAG: hypothetical protein HWQ40_11645 [Nostoc sp. NMS9]|nr:hypothetical protein [Nostoc sp. NMS9]